MSLQAEVVSSANALDALCEQIYKASIAEAKASGKVFPLIREALAAFPVGSEAFKAARKEVQSAYTLARVVVGFGVKRDKAQAYLDGECSQHFNASKVDANGNPPETMRPERVHRIIRTSESNFANYLKELGFVSKDGRANNARKPGGATSQVEKTADKVAAPAVAPKADAPVTVPTFTKDYDAKADMLAIASRLAKGIASKPKAFNGGLHAIASDFIAAMAAFQKAEAAE